MKLFNNLRIKMFTVVLLVNVLAMVLLSLVFYQQMISYYDREYAQSAYERVYISGRSIDDGFQQVYTVIMDTAYSNDLSLLLSKDDDESLKQVAVLLRQARERNSLLDSVYCYIPEKRLLIRSSTFEEIQVLSADEGVTWEILINRQKGTSPFFTKDIFKVEAEPIYLYSTAIGPDKERPVAYITGTIKERTLYLTYLEAISRKNENAVLLLDKDNSIMSSSRNPDEFDSDEICELLASSGQVRRDIRIGRENYYGSWCNLPFSQYSFCLLVDQRSLGNNVLGMELLYILLAVLVLILSGEFLYMSVARLNRPIERLAATMRQVGEGRLELRSAVEGNDEIGYLARSFNHMLDRMDKLIDNLANERALKRESELKALQYQIKPHFLYNTLNSIRFAAMMQGSKSVGDILASLISLLQASTNRNGVFTSVRNEVQVLKSYIEVQEFRLMDVFTVEFHISAEAEECVVPRLILQPLVENCILHGPSQERTFVHINIDAYLDKERLCLEVWDDGQGIPSDRLIGISDAAAAPVHGGMSGIGVANIQERLRLYYGDSGNLSFESDGSSYTLARIVLPISYDAEEYKLK